MLLADARIACCLPAGEDGLPDWRDFKDTPMAIGAAEIYYWSMDAADLDRVPPDVSHAGTGNTGRDGWIGYIAGAYCLAVLSAFRPLGGGSRIWTC